MASKEGWIQKESTYTAPKALMYVTGKRSAIATIPFLTAMVEGWTVPKPPMTIKDAAVTNPPMRNIGRLPVLSTKKITTNVPMQSSARLIMVAVNAFMTLMLLMKMAPY